MSHFLPSATLLVAFVMAAAPGTKERLETPTELQNTGFESAVLHEERTVHVYGAQPKLALDRIVFHSSHRCV